MPANCHYCDVKLFGEEVLAGLCEHCKVSPKGRTRPPTEDNRTLTWRWVRRGAGFLILASLCHLLVLAFSILCMVLPGDMQADHALSRVRQGGSLMCGFLVVAGGSLCCAVPRTSRLYLRAGTVLLLELMYATTFGAVAQAPAPEPGLLLLLAVLGLAAILALLCLLSGVAQLHGATDLAWRLVLLPIVAIGIAVLVTLIVATIALVIGGLAAVAALLLAMFLLGLTLVLYWIRLLQEVRELLTEPD